MPNVSRSFSQPIVTKTHIHNNTSMLFPGINWSDVQTGYQGSEFRSGTVTPGYVLAKATGNLPEHNFTYSSSESSVLKGMQRQRTTEVSGNWSESLTIGKVGPLFGLLEPWGGPFLSLVELNLGNEVRAKLLRKVTDSDIDLSVVAGEFRETVGMHRELALRLAGALRAAGRGDLKGVASALSMKNSGDWANAWLMVQYGIRPFVNDLYGAVKALEKGMKKEGYHLNHAKSLFEDTRTDVTGSVLDGQFTTQWKVKVEAGARVKYSIENPLVATLASLGLSNPLTLLWELKKLSFVVDWGIGIGAWLSQLSASHGKKYRSGSVTVFVRVTGHTTYLKRVNSSNVLTEHDGTSFYTRVKCVRTGYGTWPVAFLPALKDPLSLFTLTTSAALLRQLKH